MARKHLKEYIQGYVRVEVKGRNPERLVNLCLRAGFPVWDLLHVDDKVFFSTTLARYRDIHRLARRARCTPHVVRRVGLPFVLSRIRKRPVFLLVAAFVAGAFIYLQGSIWAIKVEGNRLVSGDSILSAAASAGLSKGVRRKNVEAPDVEDALAVEFPEISWVYVRFRGMLATIEVVEKSRTDLPGPGDIVASRDGIVESLLVLSGIPVVKPGQAVTAGTLLIAGDPSGSKGGARGTVMAETWYEMYRDVTLSRSAPFRTGQKVKALLARYRGNEFALWGRSNVFRWYEIEDYPKWAAFAGTPHGLEVVTRFWFEVEWLDISMSAEEAFSAAERQMRASIERELPSGAELIDLNCRIEEAGQDALSIRMTGRVREDIALHRPWPP